MNAENNKTKGFICGAIAAATYGMNPLFTLPLYSEGMTVDSVLFYRYALAVIILGIMMKLKGQSFALKKNEVLPLVTGGLLFSASSLFLFMSYKHMDAGIASTILFVYPVMVAVIMFLVFHEKISAITIFSILLSLTGISLLYQGDGKSTLSQTGMILVMLSSLSYAVYIVGVNRSALKTMPTMKLTFYALLFGLSIYIIRLRFGIELQPVTSAWSWINIIAIASMPTVISLICTATAIHRIGSTPTAILGALEPVTALFFGVIIFGEKLTPRIITGVMMILIAVTLIVIGKKVIMRVNKLFLWNKR